MNNKQKIIIAILATLLVVILIIILAWNKAEKNEVKQSLPTGSANVFTPEFMSDEEKQKLELVGDNQIQVLKKGETGETEVYRIIKPDQEIVNPAEVEAIN